MYIQVQNVFERIVTRLAFFSLKVSVNPQTEVIKQLTTVEPC